MQSKLLDLVESSSKLNLLDTAHFYASLLYSISKSTISVYSYAFTLYNTNRLVESYDLLIDNYSEIEYDIKSWLLLSDVCEKLNLHSDAMRASKQAHDLLHLNKLIPTGILTTGSTSSPAATACRLGRIAKTTNNHKSAIEYFNQALSLDHSIWEAFEALCALGADPNPAILSTGDGDTQQAPQQTNIPPPPMAQRQPSNFTEVGLFTPDMAPRPVPKMRPPALTMETPTQPIGHNNTFTDDESFALPPSVLPKRPRVNQPKQGLLQSSLKPITKKAMKQTPDALAQARRSNRLATFTSKVGISKNPVRDKRKKPSPLATKMSRSNGASNQSNDDQNGASSSEVSEQLNELVRTLGKARAALGSYRCQEAIETLNGLLGPELGQGAVGAHVGGGIARTPSALCWLGQAYFESADYIKAERAFAAARALSPHRSEDMDIYSTVLWHLNKPTSLAFLAHDMVKVDKKSYQSWVALGNALSLSNEHSDALIAFTKASSVSPLSAYSNVLAGHECIAKEEWDNATQWFQTAIRINRRMYNAWYGLGVVYLNQGKTALSEYHFKKATEINPSNVVLLCSLGSAIEKGNTDRERIELLESAYQSYNKACILQENSALARYKRANVLFLMNRFQRALPDLLFLKDAAPDEVNVHLLLGRVYRQLGNAAGAAKHFAIAQDIEPKSALIVGEIIESQYSN
ncbi:hypothetical protein E3Q23_00387 [Wallemia mellicola]|uniref:TPR-like protein n=1 Tax=Wallemia mellicola TaxID=1708541 RepID=A0A4T0TUN5_9BASI|nr:hypothetical protein E3Q23_00387 [Wallemia mellicola]TIC68998.1 TPR-like protein [Wallemia mellicola]